MTSWLVLFSAVFMLAAPGQQSDRATAAGLERGPTEQRLAAIVEILKIRPSQRGAPIAQALEREAKRLLVYYRTTKSPAESDDRELHSAYAAGLVQGLVDAHDPAAIPILADFSGFTRIATKALVGFGDLAVPTMVRYVKDGPDDLGQRSALTSALGDLLLPSSGVQLSPLNRQKLETLAEELLGRRFRSENAVGTAAFAWATGRADLREEVEALATTQEAWTRRGRKYDDDVAFVQHVILLTIQSQK